MEGAPIDGQDAQQQMNDMNDETGAQDLMQEDMNPGP